METAFLIKATIFTHDVDFLRIATQKSHLGVIYAPQRKFSVGECVKKLKVIAELSSRKKSETKLFLSELAT